MAANEIATHDANDNVFGSDENSVTLIYKNAPDNEVTLAKTDKYRLAVQIIEHIAPLLKQHQ